MDLGFLKYGFTIPKEYNSYFYYNLNIANRKSKEIKLLINDRKFKCNIVKMLNPHTKRETLNIRYHNNNELKEFLKKKLEYSYELLKNNADKVATECFDVYSTKNPNILKINLIINKTQLKDRQNQNTNFIKNNNFQTKELPEKIFSTWEEILIDNDSAFTLINLTKNFMQYNNLKNWYVSYPKYWNRLKEFAQKCYNINLESINEIPNTCNGMIESLKKAKNRELPEKYGLFLIINEKENNLKDNKVDLAFKENKTKMKMEKSRKNYNKTEAKKLNKDSFEKKCSVITHLEETKKAEHIFRKTIDISVFKYGFTIPRKYHSYFHDYLSLEKRKSKKANLLIEEREFKCNIVKKMNPKTRKYTLGLRYHKNEELKKFFKRKFKHTYKLINNDQNNSMKGNNYKESIDIKEHMDLYTTEKPNLFIVDLICKENKSDYINKVEKENQKINLAKEEHMPWSQYKTHKNQTWEKIIVENNPAATLINITKNYMLVNNLENWNVPTSEYRDKIKNFVQEQYNIDIEKVNEVPSTPGWVGRRLIEAKEEGITKKYNILLTFHEKSSSTINAKYEFRYYNRHLINKIFGVEFD